MTRALQLAERYCDAELLSLQAFVDGDPRSLNPRRFAAGGDSIWIFTPKVRKLHADIAYAIAYHRGFDPRERVEQVQGGFGCVEPLPDKDFKMVRDFFERAVFAPARNRATNAATRPCPAA